MDNIDITGLILAGGRGTRMGSADKGLQPFHGAPMIRHVMQRFAPQVGSLLISANRNLEIYKSFGVPVLPDAVPDFAGPLAGLQAGLMHCQTPWLAMVPCDSPFLPEDLVMGLQNGVESGAGMSVAVTGEMETRRMHPVFCLVKVSLLPELTTFLQGGGRKMQDWISSVNATEVHFADEAPFRNINTLEELRKIESVQDLTSQKQ